MQNVNILKTLIDNGVAIAILGFFLWFILKPLINAYIKSLEDVSASMKEILVNLKEDRIILINEIKNLNEKLYETKREIISHIDKTINHEKKQ